MTPPDSSARQPSWLARMVGPLLFAPGQQPDCVALVLVDTCAELRETVATWGGHAVDDDMEACCCFDFDAVGRDYGFMIFAREKLTRALLVHECTHAALAFVGAEVMPSETVTAMAENEQAEYYDEACARVCEHLFEQAEQLLWSRPAIVEGIPTERETGASAEGNDAGLRGAASSWSNTAMSHAGEGSRSQD